MKYKMIALSLALTVLSWAQTATQNNPAPTTSPTAQDDAKASCPCCQKMDSKDMKSCCAHEAGKDMSCCTGKDAKACMKGDKDKAAACHDGKCCGGDGEKACCAKCAEAADKAAMACCGGHCAMDHHDHTAASN